MRVGVYIDGYNLYYGGRGLAGGKGQSGWKWLDLRRLSDHVVRSYSGWSSPVVERVVYCTARIKGNQQANQDQDTYLRAIKNSGAADHIEYGTYVSRVAALPLATRGRKGKPVLTTATWPVMVKDQSWHDVPDAHFLVSVAKREEKGTDVNVGSHLLIDVMTGTIDAALVVTNDSDLRLPIVHARTHVPVGTVNPTKDYTAGALRGSPTSGAGSHWWYTLVLSDLQTCQLPNPVGGVSAPQGW